MVRLLNDLFGIQARGGCACAGPYGHTLLNIDETGSEKYLQCVLGDPEGIKPGWTRLNLAPWVTDEEADFLLSAVELVAEFVERFLPPYAFNWQTNWQTGAWTHARDGAPLDLFGAARPEHAGGPAPYAESLREARTLAETLPVEQGRPPSRPMCPTRSCSSRTDPPPTAPECGGGHA